MSAFDEQPDGDPHGECAAEIHRLQAVASVAVAAFEHLLSCVEEWAERLNACQAATEMPLPAEIHVQGQAHSIGLTLREMVAVLKINGRDVSLGE